MQKQNKRKFKTAMLSFLLVGVMVATGIGAYFTAIDTKTNVFTVGNVDIELQEPNWQNNYPTTPNETVTKDPQIKNIGDQDAYVYLTVDVPYANIVTAQLDGTKNAQADTELFSYTVNPGWVEVGTAEKVESEGVYRHVYAYASEGEGEPLEAGLYKEDGTFISWENLTSEEYKSITYFDGSGFDPIEDVVTGSIIIESDGQISTCYDVMRSVNESSSYLTGMLVIPDSISNIPSGAFSNCTGLTSVVIPDSVPSIGNNAFMDCNNLTTIYYTGTATGTQLGAENATIKPYSEAPTQEGEVALTVLSKDETTSKLFNTVTFANVVEEQGLELTDLDVVVNAYGIETEIVGGEATPEYVWEIITNQTIEGGASDEPVALAAGLYDEEGNMTKSWEQLIADGDLIVTDGKLHTDMSKCCTADAHVFDLGHKLIIADGITSIGDGTFGCNSCLYYSSVLSEVIIPDGVTSIEYRAFFNTSVEKVTIPNTVTNIGQNAFYKHDQTKDTIINYLGTISEWNAIELGENWATSEVGTKLTVHCTDGDIEIDTSL